MATMLKRGVGTGAVNNEETPKKCEQWLILRGDVCVCGHRCKNKSNNYVVRQRDMAVKLKER